MVCQQGNGLHSKVVQVQVLYFSTYINIYKYGGLGTETLLPGADPGGGVQGSKDPPGPQRGGPGPLFQNEENSIYYLQFYLIPPINRYKS